MKNVIILCGVLLLSACGGSSGGSPATPEQPETPTTPTTPTQPTETAADRLASFTEEMMAQSQTGKLYNIGVFRGNNGDPQEFSTKMYKALAQSLINNPSDNLDYYLNARAIYNHVDLMKMDDVILVSDENQTEYDRIKPGTYIYKDFARLNWQVNVDEKTYSVNSMRLMLSNLDHYDGNIRAYNLLFNLQDEAGEELNFSMIIGRMNSYQETSVYREQHDGPVSETSGHLSCTQPSFTDMGLTQEQFDANCDYIRQLFIDKDELVMPALRYCGIDEQLDSQVSYFNSGTTSQTVKGNAVYTFDILNSMQTEFTHEDESTSILTVNIKRTLFNMNRSGNYIFNGKVEGSYHDSRFTGSHENIALGFSFYCDSDADKY